MLKYGPQKRPSISKLKRPILFLNMYLEHVDCSISIVEQRNWQFFQILIFMLNWNPMIIGKASVKYMVYMGPNACFVFDTMGCNQLLRIILLFPAVLLRNFYLIFALHYDTDTPPLRRFLGLEKPRYRRSILVLKPKSREHESFSSFFTTE